MSAIAEAVRGGERKRERFFVDVPFTKAAAPDPKSGDLILEGYANTWGVDRDGEFVLPSAFDSSLPDYLAKNPIVLWQHSMDWPIGRVMEAETDTTGLRVKIVVPKPKDWDAAPDWMKAAYQTIDSGVVTTFSIGGYFWREYTEAGPIIVEVELLEISVVSIPANADSIFEAARKSLNGQSTAKLSQKAIEQMAQVLGCEPVTDPELARMGEEELSQRATVLRKVYERAGVEAPSREEWEQLEERGKQVAELPEDEVVEFAHDLGAFTEQLQGLVPAEGVKEGRVLSKANESRLRNAYKEIGAVLDQVEDQDDAPLEPGAVIDAVVEASGGAPKEAPGSDEKSPLREAYDALDEILTKQVELSEEQLAVLEKGFEEDGELKKIAGRIRSRERLSVRDGGKDDA